MGVDAEVKAKHATRMMHVAAQLAVAAPSDRQQRMLARYGLLHADSAQRWLHVWHKQLEASKPAMVMAARATPALRRLRKRFAKQKAIRDKLAAKRQAVDRSRAADLRGTVALWRSMSASDMDQLCESARAAYKALGGAHELDRPVDATIIRHARSALRATKLDPAAVYLDVTSYSAGEQNLVAVTPTGLLGGRVMQINDVHDHLEELYALRCLVSRVDDVGLALRAGLIVEVCSLVELVLGPPDRTASVRDGAPLIRLLDARRGEDGADVLAQYASKVVPRQTRVNLRDLRGRVAAHLDSRLSFDEIQGVLLEVSVDDLFGLADITLDYLDVAACQHVDLGLLALGHRRLGAVEPAERPTVPAAFQLDGSAGFLDSPSCAMVAGGFDSAMSARVAGVVAGRSRYRRTRWSQMLPQAA